MSQDLKADIEKSPLYQTLDHAQQPDAQQPDAQELAEIRNQIEHKSFKSCKKRFEKLPLRVR